MSEHGDLRPDLDLEALQKASADLRIPWDDPEGEAIIRKSWAFGAHRFAIAQREFGHAVRDALLDWGRKLHLISDSGRNTQP